MLPNEICLISSSIRTFCAFCARVKALSNDLQYPHDIAPLLSFLNKDMENCEWSLSSSGSAFQRMGAVTEKAPMP